MKSLCLLLTIFVSSAFLTAQPYKIKGKVYDKSTGLSLSYANIRIAGTSKGMTTNLEGYYQINLNKGSYILISSFIGYKNDTLRVTVTGDKNDVDFAMPPVSINLPGVTVLPGKNPALDVMKKAIARKEIRAARLNSYEFEAYTKGIIRANKDIGLGANSVSVGIDTKSDTSELKINGILENQSKGFYKKPGNFKEQIIARKQSANMPASINMLTGGRLVQNFYGDDIRFFGRPLPGPVSREALDYYYFYIVDSMAMDKEKVYKIYFEPENRSDPGFQGYIYISDSTFNLIKVDVAINKAANSGGLLEKVKVFQQFVPFEENLYMPIDYRLFVKANLLGFVEIGFELNSIMYNYKINPEIENKFFDKAIMTVLPGADNKDSTYWSSAQSIPNTGEELRAYRKIDSLKSVPVSFWDHPIGNILSDRLSISDNFAVSSLLGMYHFNRVEGHSLDFGIYSYDLLDKRLNASTDFNYGFSDKKFKGALGSSYFLGDYRTLRFSFNAFSKLKTLFAAADNYHELTSTVLALFSKYEFRDYYYSKGFDLRFTGEIFPVVKMSASFQNRTDNSAAVNTNYSFFAKNKVFAPNPPVYETRINSFTAGLSFDFRKYIEDGYYRNRLSGGNSYIILGADMTLSNKSLTGSSMDFISYNGYVNGTLNTFGFAALNYRLEGIYSEDAIPYQMQYALTGNINAASKNFSFRTVRIGEFFGNKVFTVNLEHNFRNELFRILRIPLLKDSDIQLNSFFNAAWVDMSNKSKQIMPVEFNLLQKPLFEAGFSLGHLLFPLSIEFGWRLNHTEGNKFVISVNTFAL